MRRVGLFEAKQKLSDLVEQAERGERIGITRRGKLTAVIGPAGGATNLQEVFDGIEAIRKRARKQKGVTVKQLIAEGRA
jgi:prevent-host-death family protein